MEKWEKILKERDARARKYDKDLRLEIRRFQNGLWTAIQEALLGFAISQTGNFLFSASNIRRVEDVSFAIGVETSKRKPGFIKKIIRNALQVFGVNRRYFQSIQKYSRDEIDKEVRRLVLRRLGYDMTNQRLIRGGWLDLTVNTDEVAKLVGLQMNMALAAKVSQKQFVEQLRPLFLGNSKGRLGYFESQTQQLSYDLYQQIDRQTQLLYASKIGLKHALYAGTAKDNSRDFCLQRLDNVYTVDEIATWEDLEFQGKPKIGYNPFVHCGGHNCRHHLSYLSEEIVKVMKYKVNEYNGILLA